MDRLQGLLLGISTIDSVLPPPTGYSIRSLGVSLITGDSVVSLIGDASGRLETSDAMDDVGSSCRKDGRGRKVSDGIIDSSNFRFHFSRIWSTCLLTSRFFPKDIKYDTGPVRSIIPPGNHFGPGPKFFLPCVVDNFAIAFSLTSEKVASVYVPLYVAHWVSTNLMLFSTYAPSISPLVIVRWWSGV